MSNFNDIKGYYREKEELKNICNVLNERERYFEKGARLPKGLILYGDAGNGKTLFARVLAKECGLETFVIDLSAVEDNSVCKIIKQAFFKAAKRRKPCMIFFDEIDKVLPLCSENFVSDRSKTVLTQLLTLIDGIDKHSNIFFVATCNNCFALPESFVRPGRIDKKIELSLPDYDSRVEIIKYYVGKTACKFALSAEEFAKACDGLSCAAIETIVNECVIKSDLSNFVSEERIYTQIYEIKEESIDVMLSDEEASVFSAHALGHFIVEKSLCGAECMLDIRRNIQSGYFDSMINMCECDDECDDDCEESDCEENDCDCEENDCVDDDCGDDSDESPSPRRFYGLDDLKNGIAVLFGGMFGEEVLLGKSFTGSDNDIAAANNVIKLIFANGLLGPDLICDYYNPYDFSYSDAKINMLNAAIDELLKEGYARAKKIVYENADLLKFIHPVLKKEERLSAFNVKKLIETFKK